MQPVGLVPRVDRFTVPWPGPETSIDKFVLFPSFCSAWGHVSLQVSEGRIL